MYSILFILYSDENIKRTPSFSTLENESSRTGDYFPDHIIKAELMIVTLWIIAEALMLASKLAQKYNSIYCLFSS